MPPLGVVGEIYVVSAAVGLLYLVVCVLLGQVHGHADGGHAAHGHDLGGGDHGGHALGNGAQTAGHSSAQGGGHGDSEGLDQGARPGGHHLHDEPHLDIYRTAGHSALTSHDGGNSAAVQVVEKRSFNLTRFLLTILSPMTIAMFLLFFGSVGLILTGIVPWLGALTVPPALLLAALATTRFLALLRWMVFKMNVSSHVRVQEIIGLPGEVIVSIGDGRKGEVTYVAGPSRQSAPALPANPQMKFARGDRVMITDVRDGVVYVEPWSDFLLDNEAEKIFHKKDEMKES